MQSPPERERRREAPQRPGPPPARGVSLEGLRQPGPLARGRVFEDDLPCGEHERLEPRGVGAGRLVGLGQTPLDGAGLLFWETPLGPVGEGLEV